VSFALMVTIAVGQFVGLSLNEHIRRPTRFILAVCQTL